MDSSINATHVAMDPVKPPGEGAEHNGGPAPEPRPVDFARLFREHNQALLRFAAAKLGSEQEGREVAQEAYVRLLQLERPETISHLRAFLFKTASNLATDRLRARRCAPLVQYAVEADLVAFELSPERQCAGDQMIGVLTAALAELPINCQKIFVYYRIDGLDRSEIAARMGLGERMVRLYMARTLQHIRRRLDEAAGGRGGAR
jgi:RNA polymerase sigma factor (sigma-70 family)